MEVRLVVFNPNVIIIIKKDNMKNYLQRLLNKQIGNSYRIANSYKNTQGKYVTAFSVMWKLKICHLKISLLNKMLGRNYTPIKYTLTKGSEFNKMIN